jgi:hypothetical protein
MDFAYSEKVNQLRKRLSDFMERYIYPNEQTYHDQPGVCSFSRNYGPGELVIRSI